MVFRFIGAIRMKIYTCRKRNEAEQKAMNCVKYFFNSDVNETCSKEWLNGGAFKPCVVRFGEVCPCFEPGKDIEL